MTSSSGRVKKGVWRSGRSLPCNRSGCGRKPPATETAVSGGLPGPSLAAGGVWYRTVKTPFLALQGPSREQGKASLLSVTKALSFGPSQALGGQRKGQNRPHRNPPSSERSDRKAKDSLLAEPCRTEPLRWDGRACSPASMGRCREIPSHPEAPPAKSSLQGHRISAITTAYFVA